MPQSLTEIVARVDPGRGTFRVEELGHGAFVQYQAQVPDAEGGGMKFWRGRKWYISMFMTEDEIFRTCLLAVRIFEEHEVYERFRVDGKRFLDPHPEGARVEGKVTWDTLF